MKILVCITHVPDTSASISFTEDGKTLKTDQVPFIIGPYDDYALARAVELKASSSTIDEIVALNVGTQETEAALRKALAIGADKAVRIDTYPKDAYVVASEIAKFLSTNPFDLILMGRESIDFNGGIVPGMVAAMTGILSVSFVMRLELEGRRAHLQCEIEGGTEDLSADLPLILGCQEPIAEWKIPNMRSIMMARTKPLEVLSASGVEERATSQIFRTPEPRKKVKLLESSQTDELVRLLKEEANVL